MSETATTLPDFNPSKDVRVDNIKTPVENLMSYIKSLENVDGRCRSIALTKLEEASMWAVKSLFVGK